MIEKREQIRNTEPVQRKHEMSPQHIVKRSPMEHFTTEAFLPVILSVFRDLDEIGGGGVMEPR